MSVCVGIEMEWMMRKRTSVEIDRRDQRRESKYSTIVSFLKNESIASPPLAVTTAKKQLIPFIAFSNDSNYSTVAKLALYIR